MQIAPDYGWLMPSLAFAESVAHVMLLEADDLNGLRSIRAHAEKAMALEPNNALVLGFAASALAPTWASPRSHASRCSRRSVESRRQLGHYARAVACLIFNRYDEALEHIDAEMRTMPGSH